MCVLSEIQGIIECNFCKNSQLKLGLEKLQIRTRYKVSCIIFRFSVYFVYIECYFRFRLCTVAMCSRVGRCYEVNIESYMARKIVIELCLQFRIFHPRAQ